jgi:hypothetical protein
MNTFEGPALGERVKEIISGFEGVVTGQCHYLWGCEQVLVSRPDEKGKPEAEWYDVGRVLVLADERVQPVAHPGKLTRGADKPAPIR